MGLTFAKYITYPRPSCQTYAWEGRNTSEIFGRQQLVIRIEHLLDVVFRDGCGIHLLGNSVDNGGVNVPGAKLLPRHIFGHAVTNHLGPSTSRTRQVRQRLRHPQKNCNDLGVRIGAEGVQ